MIKRPRVAVLRRRPVALVAIPETALLIGRTGTRAAESHPGIHLAFHPSDTHQ